MKKIISIALTAFIITALFVSCGTGGLDGTYVPKNCAAKNNMIAKLVFNEKEASGDFKLNDNPFTVSGGGNTVKIYMGTMDIAMPMALEGRYSLEGNKLSIEGGIPGINGTSLEFTYNKAKDEISLLTGMFDGALDEFAPVWGKEGTFDTTIDPCAKKEETNGNTSVKGKPAEENSKKGGGIFDRLFGSEQEKPNGNTSVEGKPAEENSKKGGGIFDRLFGGDGKGKDNSTDMNKEISNETITGTFTYSGGDVANDENGDFTTGFIFSTDYFNRPSTDYNRSLSIMSLQLAMAAFGRCNESYINGRKADNIKQLLSDMHFQDITHYGYNTDPEQHSIAATIARMNMEDECGYQLLVIAVRGGEYKAEWGGNFTVGNGDVHEGFDIAKEKVKDYFDLYLHTYKDTLAGKTVKLWITGYSRGAAVANLLGAYFVDKTQDGKYGSMAYTDNSNTLTQVELLLKKNNIYTYCFATPNNSKKAKYEGYENIFSFISPFDPVPKFPFQYWGFGKYGRIKMLPNSNAGDYKQKERHMLDILNTLNSSFNKDVYLIDKFKVHQGHTDVSKGAIFDIGQYEKRGKEAMDEYLERLVNNTLAIALGSWGKLCTQKEYVENKQTIVELGAMRSNGKINKCGQEGVMGFMGGIAAKGVLDKDFIGFWGGTELNDDFATLGPSEKHFENLLNNNHDLDSLKDEEKLPAVYNFNEGNYKDIAKKTGKTKEEITSESAREAQNNSKAVASGHYPELYLAWLKSLPSSYFQ